MEKCEKPGTRSKEEASALVCMRRREGRANLGGMGKYLAWEGELER